MININKSLNLLNPLKAIGGYLNASTFSIYGTLLSAGIGMIAGNQQSKAADHAADRQAEAARLAAEQAKFNPYDVQGGAFGGVQFDRDAGTAQLSLDPRMQQISDLYSQQAQQFAGQGQTALGQQAGALGQGFLGGIQTDPFAAADTQFQRMEEILNPARQRQREALEGRLLKQGRLGSTGGSLQQEGLEGAIEQSRQKGLFDALQQSQGLQAQQAGLGQQLGLFGQQQQDVGFNQSQARLGGVSGLEQQLYNAANLGSNLGGNQSAAGAQAGAFGMQGASAGTAALLGGAAGQSKAFGQLGDAFAGMNFGSNNTTRSVDFSQSGMGMTQQQMLDEQSF